MSIEILMPALSPTMEMGTLAKWLKQEGEEVKVGEVIAEIETDKATMELESIEDGILAKIVVPAGTREVKINSVIAILTQDGEELGDTDGAEAATSLVSPAMAVSALPQSVQSKSQISIAIKPATQSFRTFSSPLARRLAIQENIDLNKLKGTGTGGRIVKKDIEKFLQAQPLYNKTNTTSGTSTTNDTAGMNDTKILELYNADEYELVPHSSMRKIIAARLLESKQTVPHFYVSVDCELDKLLILRKELNSAAPLLEDNKTLAYKLSINDFIIKAVAKALTAVPEANVSWLSDAMLKHKHANIGVAVAIEGGLITPIVKCAEQKTLATLSNEMKDLIARAKTKKLKPLEYQGGSVAISNLGMYGINNFSAILNPPQAVIFAIGAAGERAIVKNNAITIANIMSVTISVDHRAVDGAVSAELIQAFKRAIEQPYTMLV